MWEYWVVSITKEGWGVLTWVKNHPDVILQICQGGVANRTMNLCGVGKLTELFNAGFSKCSKLI